MMALDAFGRKGSFPEAGYLDTGGVTRNETLEPCIECIQVPENAEIPIIKTSRPSTTVRFS